MKIFIFLSIVLGFFLANMEFSQGANLSIRKSGPSIANPGDLVTYTITYSNTVSTLESNVVITDYLPDAANCSYYSSFPSGVYNSVTNSITWDSSQIPGLAHLDAGSGENTIQVILRVGKLGQGTDQAGDGYYLNASSVTLNSYATIRSDQISSFISSDSVPTLVNYDCTFKISQPGAGIKSATGSTLTYLVALTNTGNVSQKYALGSTLYSGQHLDQFIQDLSGGMISVTPFVAPGDTYFFHYVLQTPNGTNPNHYTETKITATPNICGDSQNALYNTFIYGGQYSNYELLSVYKIDTSDPVQSGSPLTYQIVICNVGNSLDNVRLTETYPENTTFVSASTSMPCIVTGNNCWDFGILPSGNTIVTVTLEVANGLPNGTILNNTVEVSSSGKVYDTYTESTTVVSAPDLAITKTASVVDSPAGPGSIVNYTLIYTNNGNFAASGIVIKDSYDDDYMDIDDIGKGINTKGEITWNIPGSLIPGQSDTIHYSMAIKDNPLLFLNGSTNIINRVVISSNLLDSNESDNSASATVNVFVLPDLKIDKTADPAIGLVNQPITYTLTVSNIGKLNHSGSTYTVVDYLPAGTTYLSSTPSGGIYNAGTVSWTISDDLPVDGTKSFTVTLEALPCSFVGSGTLINNAVVNSTLYGDADNSNNEVILITDVVDKENPTISSPDPVFVNTDLGKCSAEVPLTVPVTADNCEILSVKNDHASTTFPVGTTTVKWSVIDIHGNVTTANQTVIVNDVSAPVADVETLPTVTGECSVIVPVPTATDNCEGIIMGKTEDALIYSAQGTYTIHWTYEDGNGNISTQTQTVVVDDITPPEMPILADVIVGECSGTPPTPTTVDNCAGIVTGKTSIIFPKTKQGKSTIIWTFDDGNGNVTSAYQNLIVDDITAPVADVQILPTLTGECSVSVSAPTATDNCKGTITGATTDPLTYSVPGTYTIHWTYDDGNGNTSTQTQTVVVKDVTPPEIAGAIAVMSVEGCDASNATPPVTRVSELEALGLTVSDACTSDDELRVTSNDIYTGEFPIVVTRTYTITDLNDNSITYIQTIIVADTQNPVIQCAEPTVDYAYQTPGAELDPIVTDNCGVVSLINDFTNSASLQGATFKLGTNVVKWTATDHSGNKTSCSITIEVADIQPPTIDCAPLVATGYAADQGVCTYTVVGTAFDPAIEDNYSEVDMVNNYNHQASLNEAQFPLGETTVIWTATDKSGNSSTCTQVIKVNDTQNPTITAPASLTVKADAGECTASALTLGTPVTADNCSVASVTNDAPEIFPLGQTVVNWTVTDKSGNRATSTQIVVVDRLPIAVDDAISLKEDAQISGNVMANDAGLCNLPIQVKSHSEPAHGELTMADNGDFTYIPDENYHGTDQFTYQICSSQSECSEATVTITVESVNDLPVAIEDTHTIQLDLVLQGDVADNDRMSGDGVNVWTIVDQPVHGTILFHPDGTYTYTPNANFLGSDSFTYKLCDADGDCSQAKVSILIEDILLPNQILTPNGDDVNDTFIIVGISLYPQNKLTVYNRWGNVVYQKNNYQNEWDGNSNMSKIGSKSLPVGTYYYLIDYGKGRHKTGFVYLDR